MRKHGQSEEQDYIKDELEYGAAEYEESDAVAYDEDFEYEEYDEDNYPKAPTLGKKIFTVIIVLAALVALFFVSSKLTSLWLDYNQEPESYQNEIPDMESDETVEGLVEEDENDITSESNQVPPEVLGGETGNTPAPAPEKPAASTTPTTPNPSTTPSAPETKPETKPEVKPETPSTQEPAPSVPDKKPAIVPGNPSA